jgi:hypothetical protein
MSSFRGRICISLLIQHLEKSGAQLHDNDQVHRFLQVHLLHWLEALSWIGKTSEGILAIYCGGVDTTPPESRQTDTHGT